jgi:glucans biosynthesis protein C
VDSHTPFEKAGTRLFFVDHLRAALVILVVLHHLAVIYGANTPFYYLEPAYSQVLALVVLVVFQLFNQAYFMGFFFMISGYFTPGSFDRKGPASFVKDRLLRLGIPMIVYMLVLGPIASIGTYQMPAELTKITTPFTWQQYPNLIGIGPLWFAAVLLIFDFGYAAWRLATRNRVPRGTVVSALPRYRVIGVFVLALALASYLIRIPLPLGTYWPRMAVVNFPSLAYFPQYISFFIIGAIASNRNWLRTIPGSMGKWGFGAALVATVVLFPIALRGGGTNFLGGGQWPSGVYALWDSTFSVGMCLGLIVLFRSIFDHPGRLGGFLSRHAYAVYVIHIPTIVLLALALRGIHPEQLLKFGLAAITGVPLCFVVAYLVRKIPLAARVI